MAIIASCTSMEVSLTYAVASLSMGIDLEYMKGEEMKRSEKQDLIEKLENSYRLIDDLVCDLPPDAISFVPEIEDAWSINDFLVHFLDADTSLAFRTRVAIAEPGAAAPAWDEESWRVKLRYEEQDGRKCLELAKALRSFIAGTLRSLVDEDWDKFFFSHSSRGIIALPALIELYREHVTFHASMIKRNRDAWKARESRR